MVSPSIEPGKDPGGGGGGEAKMTGTVPKNRDSWQLCRHKTQLVVWCLCMTYLVSRAVWPTNHLHDNVPHVYTLTCDTSYLLPPHIETVCASCMYVCTFRVCVCRFMCQPCVCVHTYVFPCVCMHVHVSMCYD